MEACVAQHGKSRREGGTGAQGLRHLDIKSPTATCEELEKTGWSLRVLGRWGREVQTGRQNRWMVCWFNITLANPLWCSKAGLQDVDGGSGANSDSQRCMWAGGVVDWVSNVVSFRNMKGSTADEELADGGSGAKKDKDASDRSGWVVGKSERAEVEVAWSWCTPSSPLPNGGSGIKTSARR
ncbi:uncharacterized protein BDZ99DRAFT_501049 [Mytilinidion resinicola]|uniref:Uncharacterized protein n=1 Tax=Mytilinidion resinicola TaxID=574789 RepID=A0A6A6YER2_9PEZI|nr:uncharacterized protein BDZ99DRAFT_501049 [Mytilinidion resinicola]KAF2807058.1 hypothetical protein BDZ99DRAFT_501049 [Mytilinidion resinicola]